MLDPRPAHLDRFQAVVDDSGATFGQHFLHDLQDDFLVDQVVLGNQDPQGGKCRDSRLCLERGLKRAGCGCWNGCKCPEISSKIVELHIYYTSYIVPATRGCPVCGVVQDLALD